MDNLRIRCPITTSCDLCLCAGRERVAAVRRIHAARKAHARILRAGAPHVGATPGSTYADVCRSHDRRYVAFRA